MEGCFLKSREEFACELKNIIFVLYRKELRQSVICS